MIVSKRQWVGIILGAFFLAHFFIALGTDTPWLLRLTDVQYYLELFFVGIIAAAALLVIVVQHNYLQQKLPLNKKFWKRIALQLLAGVALPAAQTFFLTWMYMAQVLHIDIAQSTFFIYEFPVSFVVNALINLLLLLDVIRHPAANDVEIRQAVSTLIVSKGQRQVPVPVSEVACITKEGDFCLLITLGNEQYSITQTLDQLESMLSGRLFFRANRQTIVSRAVCDHFVSDRSGKLTLYLKQPVARELTISQKRAADFRLWLAN
jgi:DNA-binding LytR/AlgR family response regulator